MCFSKTEHEPQGGEQANAALDGQYKRLRRVVAKLAHKAQWHNNGTILIYASAECVPTRSGRRGFPFKGERRWGKHVRKGEVKFECIPVPCVSDEEQGNKDFLPAQRTFCT